MNKELFGVFGGRDRFCELRSPAEFDRIVEGSSVTVGVRDPGLDVPNRSTVAAAGDDVCVLWGEVFAPPHVDRDPGAWLLRRYLDSGTDALSDLNGSYLAVVDADGDAFVATDPIRSWQCYYTDDPGVRVFGTDPVAVARTVRNPRVSSTALLEFFHFSVITGDRTVFEQLERAPLDGYVGRDTVGDLDRFVYDPRSFDYVDELAERLERALRRRSSLPGSKGLLLSGGYDSRLVAAGIDGLDRCYTLGYPDRPAVDVARRVAKQYGADHRTLPIDDRYLSTDWGTVRYGHGIKESLHIHHGGYLAEMDADVMYHGLLFDTILRGHFLPRDGIEVRGYTFPRYRLDPDPNPVELVLEKFGHVTESESAFPTCDRIDADSGREFIESIVERNLGRLADRFDSIHNGIELFGIQNQPSMPFRIHLADHFLESFVTADAELLDWHLTTPPEHRNTRTFLEAIRRVDDDVLRHPPHDRPHSSRTANEIEGFLRRKLPFVEPFEPPWPDRKVLYERANLDEELFEPGSDVRDLPPRLKLRLNDVTSWIANATGEPTVSPSDVLCPSFEGTHQQPGETAAEPFSPTFGTR